MEEASLWLLKAFSQKSGSEIWAFKKTGAIRPKKDQSFGMKNITILSGVERFGVSDLITETKGIYLEVQDT